MKNIFESLSRYPPIEKNNPEENQLTESFAFLIDHVPQLLTFLLTELLEGQSVLEKKPKPEDLTVLTQNTRYSTVSGGIHDLTIRSKKPDFLVIIENKKFSQIDVGQLRKYLKDINDFIKELKKREGFLLLITPPRDDEEILSKIKENPVFIHKYWFEICRVIEKFKDEHYSSSDSADNKNKFLLEQFLEYTEVIGLTVDFTYGDFNAFNGKDEKEGERYNSKNKLKVLVDEVHRRLPNDLRRKLKYHTVGNMSSYGCWGYLSEEENQSTHAHYSLSLYRDGMYAGIRLERKSAVGTFYKVLSEDKKNKYKNFLKAASRIKKIAKKINDGLYNDYFFEITKLTSNIPRFASNSHTITDCKLFFKYFDEETADYLFNRLTQLEEIKELNYNSTPLWITEYYDRTYLTNTKQDDLVESIIVTIEDLEPLYKYVRGEYE